MDISMCNVTIKNNFKNLVGLKNVTADIIFMFHALLIFASNSKYKSSQHLCKTTIITTTTTTTILTLKKTLHSE